MARSRTRAGNKPTYRPTDREKKILADVEECIKEGSRWHTNFLRKVARRYDAWRGMQPDNAPKSWRSNQHAPYLINIVEGMLSSMEEARPSWQVSPRALPGMSMEEIYQWSRNAEINQHLLAHDMRVDKFTQKQSPFMHQDLIAGYSPGKIYWLKERRDRPYLDEQPEMIYDENGGSIDIAMKLDEYVDKDIVFRDSPTFEVRDVRDWMVPESATDVQKSPWVLDRVFVTPKTLERMERLGIWKNTQYVSDTRHDSRRDAPDIDTSREQRLRGSDRTRGLVEIIELWTDDGIFTVANRSVVLRDDTNNFWHGLKPFVVSSAIPDLFQIPGISVIEGLAQMQEMLWTMQNLRFDATRMLANVITVIRGDVENADEFEWAPNAQWFVNDLNAVKTLDIDPSIANITLQSEALLKGDIQSVMGALPFQGNAQQQTQNIDTATGMSIVTNIAQAVLARRRGFHMRTFSEVGQFFLSLDQQFLRDEKLIEVLGPGGAREWLTVSHKDIDGVFDVELEMVGDSMMRQEKRAESGQLLTQAHQFAGPAAQFGVALNLKTFWVKHLKAFDIEDTENYFMEKQEMPAMAQQVMPGGAGAGTPSGAQALMEDMTGALEAGGVTNRELAAGPTSPSNDISMSPSASTQRALAASGSGRSV